MKQHSFRMFAAVVMLAGAFSFASPPAMAMTLEDAVDTIHTYGNQDISVIRKISPPLADTVQGGWDSVHTWCSASEVNQIVCISTAVALLAS